MVKVIDMVSHRGTGGGVEQGVAALPLTAGSLRVRRGLLRRCVVCHINHPFAWQQASSLAIRVAAGHTSNARHVTIE